MAAQQHAQLAVRDVRPLPAGDASGLALFFFLIICTLGGFLTVTATALAAPALRPQYRWPLFLAATVATPVLGYLLGGQGLGAISGRSTTAPLPYPCPRPTGATIRCAFPALQAQACGGDTVLTGPLRDRAALYGLLAEIEALGLELLEVRRLPPV